MHLLLIAAICFAATTAYAREWFKERRIGTGVELVHQSGMAAASIALSPTSFLLWEDNYGAALSYSFGQRRGWSGSVGAIMVAHTDEDVGTRLNFLFNASYCGKAICLTFSHISHGSAIGIETDKANSGLNFLLLEYRFR